MKIQFDVTSSELKDILHKQGRMLVGRLECAVKESDYENAKTLINRVQEMDKVVKDVNAMLANQPWATVVISICEPEGCEPPSPAQPGLL